MATKTLTIMDDVYKMLVKNKLENESFSDELRRVLSRKKKKSLKDFFGIFSEEEGNKMFKDLEKMREFNLRALKEELKNEST